MKIKMKFHIISSIILIHFFVILLNAKQIDNTSSNRDINHSNNNNNNNSVYNNNKENHSQTAKLHHLHSHHHRHKHNNKDNSTRELLRNSLINHNRNDNKPLAMTVTDNPHPKNQQKMRRNNKKIGHLKTTTARVYNPKSEKLEDEFAVEYHGGGRDINYDYEFHNGVEPRINPAPSTSSSSSSSTSLSSSAATPYIKSTTPMSENRICANAKIVNVPYRTNEVYNKPVYRAYSEPCHNNGQMCSGVRLVHEPIVRTVTKYRKSKQVVYTCCNGWEKLNEADTGCNKPICSRNCRNNGKCVRPDTCECATGFTGIYCEKDINECMEDKPCDQSCYNTEGSYYCTCRDGFTLHTDKQSCKKRYNPDEDAIEARDLETNDIDDFNYDDINARLEKIENILASERFEKNKFTKTLDTVTTLQQRIDVIEHKQQDIKNINEKMRVYDDQAKRIEHVMDLLFKCRTKSSIYCP